MSQYVEFYLRVGDRFAPIITRSRSTTFYQLVHHCLPYGKVRALGKDVIEEFKNEAKSEIRRLEENIAHQRELMEMISKFNNSVDEKLQAAAESQDYIEELEQELASVKSDLAFFEVLGDMWEEAEQTRWYKNERPDAVIDPNEYIYAGVECGFPTLEDIEEKNKEE